MVTDLPPSPEQLVGKKHPSSPLGDGEDCDEGSRHPKRHHHSYDGYEREDKNAPLTVVPIPSMYVVPGVVDGEREEEKIFEDEEVPDYMVRDRVGRSKDRSRDRAKERERRGEKHVSVETGDRARARELYDWDNDCDRNMDMYRERYRKRNRDYSENRIEVSAERLRETIKMLLLNIKPKDIGALFTRFHEEDPKMLTHSKDLLETYILIKGSLCL